ncbi:hypothetical protein IW140_005536 [Coemansia sp. RSA 1813]|nr:hypothetical protein LPJ74_006113 [Coemansia sp. RSA 1843]KAJ2086800.1 hypothetical protein IW138_005427 [Coemansia sp. RSA 986]KAJ2211383.1 hypothetical protein EV179_005520 [Coemansia sp. RSA 487]KAJ2564954.1 hypothetical protein IW140_005536 [Coemansia sp. RSA 1813]
MRIAFTLGLLAATTALSAFVPGDTQQAPIKTFTPLLKNKTRLNVYESPISVQTSDTTQVGSFVGPSSKNQTMQELTSVAAAYLSKHHGISAKTIKVTDAYTDAATGITHVYARQLTPTGLEVANGLANVNINANGQIISSSNSFAPESSVPKTKRGATGSLVARANSDASLRAAFKSLAGYVKTPVDDSTLDALSIATTTNAVTGDPTITISGLPDSIAEQGMSSAQQALLQKEDGTVVQVWHIALQQSENWWSAHVNSETGAVEAINNWVSHASAESFNVYPRTVDAPDEGSRKIVSSPADATASSKGWVTGGSTTGNNVWAQNNPTGGSKWKTNYRPNATNNVFDFPLDLTKEPSKYVDAAITQLFYTVNTMHDLSYLYGFDEAAGNFQDINHSGQGVGGDYVVAFAQDGSGTNNANFATPPDGQNGVMRMYTWTQTTPNRDGDLEQDIVAHEFTHGISNRLTGGPANSDCLYNGEAGGMGEGWSDMVANLLRIRPGDKRSRDLTMGVYAYGSNIRNYPYSTSLKTNPETYAYLDKSAYQEVHAIGEVWATILYEVLWNLLEANGIADSLFDHDLSKGNSIMLQILLDGMKLQPCNPSFIDARDAIVQAEKNLTGGKNKCAVWKGFAKRGLGVKAASSWFSHTEDYSVPSGC